MYRSRQRHHGPGPGGTKARAWGAMAILAPLLGGCLTLDVIGKDISDSASSNATVACKGDAAGTIPFALAGDGTLSNLGPTAVAAPGFRATTVYRPTPGTGLSRDVHVTCTFVTAAGKTETATGKIVVRETLDPVLVNLTAPANARVGRHFDVKITVKDPKNAGPGMVGWVSGIDIVSMTGAGDVAAVPVNVKDFAGIPPGPPTHARGEEAPPEITFVGKCLRPGAGSVRLMVNDTAGNFLHPAPEAMLECLP